ncbi:hypothetical protein NSS79_14210 [Paenibacillus sp. FSL L8-0436]|uniref:hypothetical protein n=1 Tax=Paenibacillus sp. FSL L8-0436 TaxID=2954686 RepID=UPI00315842BF
MITVVGGVVLFLLFAAGLLAYQSSRMISEREASESAAPTGSLMYSVVNQAFAEHEERPEAVPLFQFTVLSGPGEQLAKGEKGTTSALCRVPAGTGEMVLTDAENWMRSNLRKASIEGARVVFASFPEKADRRGEKELIRNLEVTAREEAEHANHH